MKKGRWVPNQFYFAVPPELVEHALNKCVGKPYGVMQILPDEPYRTKSVFYSTMEEKYFQRRMRQLEKMGFTITDTVEEDFRYKITCERMEHKPAGQRCRIVKRAKNMHILPVDEHVKETIVQRLGSELANFYQNWLLEVRQKSE